MRILITGATGFIGTHLSAELAKKNDIICMTRNRKKAMWLENIGCKIISGSLENRDSLDKAVKNCDAVYHLASVVNPDITHNSHVCENVIVKGTKNLADACEESGIKKFVYFSSIAAIGTRNMKRGADENIECRPNKPYGIAKRKAELMLIDKFHETNFPAVILRPPTIYGSGDRYNFLNLAKSMIQKSENNKPFYFIGNGKTLTSMCYVKNLVKGTEIIGKKGLAGETYHVSDARPYTTREIVENIADEMGCKIRYKSISHTVAFASSLVMEPMKYLGFETPLHMKKYKELTANFWLDISKARELGYVPRDALKDFVKETIQYYRDCDLIR